jgi:hypothetical protein
LATISMTKINGMSVHIQGNIGAVGLNEPFQASRNSKPGESRRRKAMDLMSRSDTGSGAMGTMTARPPKMASLAIDTSGVPGDLTGHVLFSASFSPGRPSLTRENGTVHSSAEEKQQRIYVHERHSHHCPAPQPGHPLPAVAGPRACAFPLFSLAVPHLIGAGFAFPTRSILVTGV